MKRRAAMLYLILMASAMTGFLHFGSMDAGGTPVSGVMSADTTWNLAGSPYIVVGDVTIANGVDLTISPGAEIRFDGHYSVYVDGSLDAIGTDMDRIKITSNMANPSPGDWGSIRVNSTGHAEIRNSDISYGGGIGLVTSSNNKIINNHFTFNNGAISLCWGSNDNELINNTISNNRGGFGLCFGADRNTIDGNIISNNDGVGIYLEEGPSDNIIANNTISSNKGDGIFIDLWLGHNIIRGNTISLNSGFGLYLTSTWDNIIYHNNIVNNTLGQAYDDSVSSTWNDVYPSGGNYWSDFSPSCPDDFSGPTTPQSVGSPDGICDSQYVIDGGSVDYFPLKNPLNLSPPAISNLQPPNGSVINQNRPGIGADYSDPSGIDAAATVLAIDGTDVTASSETLVLPDGISYTPSTPLSDGSHEITLKTSDIGGSQAMTTWFFTTDTAPPSIVDLKPLNSSISITRVTAISANYSDSSGINISGVIMNVDGIDVTSLATLTTSGITYIPSSALSDGFHTVNLEVRDIAGNLATALWSFEVDTKPPSFTSLYLQPPINSTTSDNTPTITAAFSDSSGIDVSSIALKVDAYDVTFSSTVTPGAVVYTPSVALGDGLHSVYLEVKDVNGNLAETSWLFTVDTSEEPLLKEQTLGEILLRPVIMVVLVVLYLLYLLALAGRRKPRITVPSKDKEMS